MSDITIPVLPADLPEDFKMQDIIAPNGADVGKSPQHGYNYLMQQMNETQRAVMKMAEDANSALENNANNALYFLGGFSKTAANTGYATLALYIKSLYTDGRRGVYGVVADFLELPRKSWGYEFVALAGESQTTWNVEITENGSGKRWFRQLNALTGVWSFDARESATAEPPQEYNLPLAAGWTGIAKYFKTQDGICTVSIEVTKSSAFVVSDVIGILPEGFRPKTALFYSASTFAPTGGITILIGNVGNIQLGDVTNLQTNRVVYLNATFLIA